MISEGFVFFSFDASDKNGTVGSCTYHPLPLRIGLVVGAVKFHGCQQVFSVDPKIKLLDLTLYYTTEYTLRHTHIIQLLPDCMHARML